MTPEEYRALAERLARLEYESVWTEEMPALLREASAALPALLDANEALRVRYEGRKADWKIALAQRDEARAGGGYLTSALQGAAAERADHLSDNAALRAQLADARVRTLLEAHEALVEHAKMMPVGRSNSRQRWRWAAFDEAASVVAALSVPAVPPQHFECALCDGPITTADDLISINVNGHAKAAHRTCPSVPAVPEEKEND